MGSPAGPSNPTPPPGPGRYVAPLSATQRLDNYFRQTGRPVPTPRQWRRIVHKAGHALRAV